MYRRWLVGAQYNDGKGHSQFAATLPLEALRMVIGNAVSGHDNRCLMLIDVSRAYMHVPVSERLFVDICE